MSTLSKKYEQFDGGEGASNEGTYSDEGSDSEDETENEDSESGEETESEDSEEESGEDDDTKLQNETPDVDEESTSDGNGEQESCPICLARFKNQPLGTPESCEHTFCLECISEWSKNINTCPIDRTEFNRIHMRSTTGGKVLNKIQVEVRPKSPESTLQNDVTSCEVCHRGDREDRLLLCDACDLAYHCECLDPPLFYIPIDEWFCPPCSRVLRTGAMAGCSAPRSRRVIPRTRASETVRKRVQNLRTTTNRSSSQSASTRKTSTKSPQRRRRRRTYKRSYKKVVQLARTKKNLMDGSKGKSCVKGSTVVVTYRRKGRRRRKRKSKKSTKVKTSSGQAAYIKSAQDRIAKRLGLCKSSKGGAIPDVKSKGGPSSTSSKSLASVSLFGSKDELVDFTENDDVGAPGPSKPSSSSSKSSSFSNRSRQISQPSTSSLNLLDSIIASQTLLHSKPEKVVIRSDGSLTLKKDRNEISAVNKSLNKTKSSVLSSAKSTAMPSSSKSAALPSSVKSSTISSPKSSTISSSKSSAASSAKSSAASSSAKLSTASSSAKSSAASSSAKSPIESSSVKYLSTAENGAIPKHKFISNISKSSGSSTKFVQPKKSSNHLDSKFDTPFGILRKSLTDIQDNASPIVTKDKSSNILSSTLRSIDQTNSSQTSNNNGHAKLSTAKKALWKSTFDNQGIDKPFQNPTPANSSQSHSTENSFDNLTFSQKKPSLEGGNVTLPTENQFSPDYVRNKRLMFYNRVSPISGDALDKNDSPASCSISDEDGKESSRNKKTLSNKEQEKSVKNLVPQKKDANSLSSPTSDNEIDFDASQSLISFNKKSSSLSNEGDVEKIDSCLSDNESNDCFDVSDDSECIENDSDLDESQNLIGRTSDCDRFKIIDSEIDIGNIRIKEEPLSDEEINDSSCNKIFKNKVIRGDSNKDLGTISHSTDNSVISSAHTSNCQTVSGTIRIKEEPVEDCDEKKTVPNSLDNNFPSVHKKNFNQRLTFIKEEPISDDENSSKLPLDQNCKQHHPLSTGNQLDSSIKVIPSLIQEDTINNGHHNVIKNIVNISRSPSIEELPATQPNFNALAESTTQTNCTVESIKTPNIITITENHLLPHCSDPMNVKLPLKAPEQLPPNKCVGMLSDSINNHPEKISKNSSSHQITSECSSTTIKDDHLNNQSTKSNSTLIDNSHSQQLRQLNDENKKISETESIENKLLFDHSYTKQLEPQITSSKKISTAHVNEIQIIPNKSENLLTIEVQSTQRDSFSSENSVAQSTENISEISADKEAFSSHVSPFCSSPNNEPCNSNPSPAQFISLMNNADFVKQLSPAQILALVTNLKNNLKNHCLNKGSSNSLNATQHSDTEKSKIPIQSFTSNTVEQQCHTLMKGSIIKQNIHNQPVETMLELSTTELVTSKPESTIQGDTTKSISDNIIMSDNKKNSSLPANKGRITHCALTECSDMSGKEVEDIQDLPPTQCVTAQFIPTNKLHSTDDEMFDLPATQLATSNLKLKGLDQESEQDLPVTQQVETCNKLSNTSDEANKSTLDLLKIQNISTYPKHVISSKIVDDENLPATQPVTNKSVNKTFDCITQGTINSENVEVDKQIDLPANQKASPKFKKPAPIKSKNIDNNIFDLPATQLTVKPSNESKKLDIFDLPETQPTFNATHLNESKHILESVPASQDLFDLPETQPFIVNNDHSEKTVPSSYLCLDSSAFVSSKKNECSPSSDDEDRSEFPETQPFLVGEIQNDDSSSSLKDQNGDKNFQSLSSDDEDMFDLPSGQPMTDFIEHSVTTSDLNQKKSFSDLEFKKPFNKSPLNCLGIKLPIIQKKQRENFKQNDSSKYDISKTYKSVSNEDLSSSESDSFDDLPATQLMISDQCQLEKVKSTIYGASRSNILSDNVSDLPATQSNNQLQSGYHIFNLKDTINENIVEKCNKNNLSEVQNLHKPHQMIPTTKYDLTTTQHNILNRNQPRLPTDDSGVNINSKLKNKSQLDLDDSFNSQSNYEDLPATQPAFVTLQRKISLNSIPSDSMDEFDLLPTQPLELKLKSSNNAEIDNKSKKTMLSSEKFDETISASHPLSDKNKNIDNLQQSKRIEENQVKTDIFDLPSTQPVIINERRNEADFDLPPTQPVIFSEKPCKEDILDLPPTQSAVCNKKLIVENKQFNQNKNNSMLKSSSLNTDNSNDLPATQPVAINSTKINIISSVSNTSQQKKFISKPQNIFPNEAENNCGQTFKIPKVQLTKPSHKVTAPCEKEANFSMILNTYDELLDLPETQPLELDLPIDSSMNSGSEDPPIKEKGLSESNAKEPLSSELQFDENLDDLPPTQLAFNTDGMPLEHSFENKDKIDETALTDLKSFLLKAKSSAEKQQSPQKVCIHKNLPQVIMSKPTRLIPTPKPLSKKTFSFEPDPKLLEHEKRMISSNSVFHLTGKSCQESNLIHQREALITNPKILSESQFGASKNSLSMKKNQLDAERNSENMHKNLSNSTTTSDKKAQIKNKNEYKNKERRGSVEYVKDKEIFEDNNKRKVVFISISNKNKQEQKIKDGVKKGQTSSSSKNKSSIELPNHKDNAKVKNTKKHTEGKVNVNDHMREEKDSEKSQRKDQHRKNLDNAAKDSSHISHKKLGNEENQSHLEKECLKSQKKTPNNSAKGSSCSLQSTLNNKAAEMVKKIDKSHKENSSNKNKLLNENVKRKERLESFDGSTECVSSDCDENSKKINSKNRQKGKHESKKVQDSNEPSKCKANRWDLKDEKNDCKKKKRHKSIDSPDQPAERNECEKNKRESVNRIKDKSNSREFKSSKTSHISSDDKSLRKEKHFEEKEKTGPKEMLSKKNLEKNKEHRGKESSIKCEKHDRKEEKGNSKDKSISKDKYGNASKELDRLDISKEKNIQKSDRTTKDCKPHKTKHDHTSLENCKREKHSKYNSEEYTSKRENDSEGSSYKKKKSSDECVSKKTDKRKSKDYKHDKSNCDNSIKKIKSEPKDCYSEIEKHIKKEVVDQSPCHKTMVRLIPPHKIKQEPLDEADFPPGFEESSLKYCESVNRKQTSSRDLDSSIEDSSRGSSSYQRQSDFECASSPCSSKLSERGFSPKCKSEKSSKRKRIESDSCSSDIEKQKRKRSLSYSDQSEIELQTQKSHKNGKPPSSLCKKSQSKRNVIDVLNKAADDIIKNSTYKLTHESFDSVSINGRFQLEVSKESPISVQSNERKVDKKDLKEEIAAEVKKVLKPFFSVGVIDKDDYKDIMRKAVPKIFLNCNNIINPEKIKKLVLSYVSHLKTS